MADRGLLYQQIFSHEICSIQHGDGPSGLPLGRHLHEGNPLPLAGLPVVDNPDGDDISGVGEKGFEFGFAGLERKVSYVNLLIHLPSFLNTANI
jgi:hypothetical protein